ncbi:hypothetical protein BGW80DRAFT_1435149 [Lactifluus volemus]|nr:hypothetical protein BGW80DRAFT_1435149 [Lactifluus volemus]
MAVDGIGDQTREHIVLLDKLAILSRVFAAALLCLTSASLPLFDASPRILDGYLYEHYWAFFPGLPWLSRLAENLPAFKVDSTTAAHAWVALLHVALAIPTTRAIYNLTLIHFRSPSFSLLTALLSLLPASPVTLYFAPYAEPIFTFLSYRGMLACARERYLPASLYLRRRRPSDGSLPPPWCNDFIPSIYTHVQRTYWHVGFLSYWTFAQLPNILLALPLLVPLLLYSMSHISCSPLKSTAHAVHAAIFGLTLLTNAHTQIALRLLPALPSTYWAAAALVVERPRWGRAYIIWAVLWGATSIVLWAAFLPPA